MTKPSGKPTDREAFLTWGSLREVLSYEPDTGDFRWVNGGRGFARGSLAGCIDQRYGYRRIKLLGRSFFASRLAWLYMTRQWPTDLIDHRNGIPSDDRWENLREASREENQHNRKTPANSKTGITGVYWHTPNSGWAAQIRVSGRRIYLGTFASVEEATVARKIAESRYFGAFCREAVTASVFKRSA